MKEVRRQLQLLFPIGLDKVMKGNLRTLAEAFRASSKRGAKHFASFCKLLKLIKLIKA